MDAFDAEEVRKLIWEKLHLENVALSDYGRVVAAVLRGAVEASESLEVKAAGELLGFGLVTREVIANFLARKRPKWVPEEPWQRKTKTARYYTALVAAGRPDAAVETARNLQPRWVSAMARALFEYLDRHRGRALEAIDDLNLLDGLSESDASIVSVDAEGEGLTKESHRLVKTLPRYIHRREIEAEFDELVCDGAKLIALVGFPGMGKTFLAQFLAGEAAPLIELKDGRLNSVQVQAVAEAWLPGDHVVTDENARTIFAKLLMAPSSTGFLVLDNLQSTDELKDFVPPNTTTVVIATSRTSGKKSPSWCQEIRVGRMTLNESTELVKRIAPSLAGADGGYLVASLHCYPLALSVACGMVIATGVEVEDLCRSLRANPGAVETTAEEQLGVLLGQTVDELRRCSPESLDLLAYIVSEGFLPSLPYGGTIAMRDLQCLAYVLYGYDRAPERYAAAMFELRRRFLVDFVVHGLYVEIYRLVGLEDEAARLRKDSPRLWVACHSFLAHALLNLLGPEIEHLSALLPQLDKHLLDRAKQLTTERELLWVLEAFQRIYRPKSAFARSSVEQARMSLLKAVPHVTLRQFETFLEVNARLGLGEVDQAGWGTSLDSE